MSPPTSDHSPKPDTADSQENLSAADTSNTRPGGMSLEEEAVLRAERLRTIRKAVEDGAYDSEEILAIAMERLRKTIAPSDDQSGRADDEPETA